MHPDAFVAPTATLVGDVRVEAYASIWYGAVLRADLGPIIVREGTAAATRSPRSARAPRSAISAWCTAA